MNFRAFIKRLANNTKIRLSRPNATRTCLFLVLHPAGLHPSRILDSLCVHPDVLCHRDVRELFSRRGLGVSIKEASRAKQPPTGVAAFKSANPAILLYKYAFDPQGRKAVGLAIDYDTLLSSLYAPIRSILMWDIDVRVLQYVPGNYMRTYIAETQRQQAISESHAISVEPQLFLSYAQQLDRMNNYVQRLFQGHRQLQIDDLQLRGSKRDAALNQVQKFLGIQLVTMVDSDVKAATPELRMLISNFDIVKDALRETPYLRALGL